MSTAFISPLSARPTASPSTPKGISPSENPNLPVEIVLKIFRGLSVSDAARASCVCWEWHDLLNDRPLWAFYLARDLQRSETASPKELYREICSFNSNLAKGIYSTRVIEVGGDVVDVCVKDKKLITASSEGAIGVLNLETGVCEKTLDGDPDGISALCLTKEGILLSGGRKGRILVWNLEDGVCKKTFSGHGSLIVSLISTKNGKIASGSHRGIIAISDLSSGICEKAFKGHREDVTSFVLTDDGKLVSGSVDGKIKLWELPSGRLKKTLGETQGPIFSLCLTEGGKLISSSGYGDSVIEVWDIKKGRRVKTLGGTRGPIVSLCATKEGKLISGDADGTIKIWDLETGACENTIEGDRNGFALSLILTEDHKLLSGSHRGRIKVFDFSALKNVIYEELALVFEEGEPGPARAMQRFLSMAAEERGKIYAELYEILKPFQNGYWRCAEHAFHDQHGLSSTPQQKAQAIRNYLNR